MRNVKGTSQKLKDKFLGKYILIGLTYEDTEGHSLRTEQVHGLITYVSERLGIMVELKGYREGEELWLSSSVKSIEPESDERTFDLEETREIVTADILADWTIVEYEAKAS